MRSILVQVLWWVAGIGVLLVAKVQKSVYGLIENQGGLF